MGKKNMKNMQQTKRVRILLFNHHGKVKSKMMAFIIYEYKSSSFGA